MSTTTKPTTRARINAANRALADGKGGRVLRKLYRELTAEIDARETGAMRNMRGSRTVAQLGRARWSVRQALRAAGATDDNIPGFPHRYVSRNIL